MHDNQPMSSSHSLKYKLGFIRIMNRTSRTMDWVLFNVSMVLKDDGTYCLESFTHKDGTSPRRLNPIIGKIDNTDMESAMKYISSDPAKYTISVSPVWEHLWMDVTIEAEDGNEFAIKLLCPEYEGWLVCIYNATYGDGFKA
jgi:hypothetical protein